MSSEEGRVEVTLSFDAAFTVVPALSQRLLVNLAALMTGLAEARRVGRAFGDRSSGTCSLLLQQSHEGTRPTKRDTAAKPLLKGAIGHFFQANVVAHCEDTMHKLPMQRLAMGGLLALEFSQLDLRLLLTAGLVPAFRAGANRPRRLVVVGV